MPKRKTTKTKPRRGSNPPSPADAKAIAAALKIPEEDFKQLGVRKVIRTCADGTRRYTMWSAHPFLTFKKSRVNLIRELGKTSLVSVIRKAAAKKAAKTKTKAKNKAKDKTKTKAKAKRTAAKAAKAAKAKTTTAKAKTTVDNKDIHIHISISPTRRGTRDRKQRFDLIAEFQKGAEFDTCTPEESYEFFE